ncbi:MAG TPA: hypothetical protein VMJ74_01530 [Pseudomonadales bacterium]|nr:hypothetical protein [Pseudomonadales bacterium]
MKVIGAIVAILLLIVIGIFVYVGYNTNAIVKTAIETLGTQYLGAPVSVGKVDISLADGKGTLSDLEVGNPPGYSGPYALRVGTITVGLDVANTKSELVVLKQLTIDGTRIAAVANTPKETNLKALAANVPASNSPSPLKLIVDKLDVTHTQATVSSPLVTKAFNANVPDVHLKDVGRSTGGAALGTVIEQVLEPIVAAIGQSVAQQGMKELGVDSDQLKSDAQKKIFDALQGGGHN